MLGIGSEPGGRSFDASDAEVLETFAGLAALALRNAEAFEERTRQAGVERGFYRIASALGQSLSLADTVPPSARPRTRPSAATSQPSCSRTGLASSWPAPIDFPSRSRRRSRTASSPTRQPCSPPPRHIAALAASDVGRDDRFEAYWKAVAVRAGYRSLLAVPVSVPDEDRTAGLVLVFFAAERRFADEDLELAAQLASAAHGALERSSRFERERRARALAQQLARTGSLLATALDPAAVLDEVVAQAPALLGVDACAVRVLEGNELVLITAVGEGVEAALGSTSPTTGRLSGEVAQSRAPLAVEDAAADARLRRADRLLELGHRAYLGVPLAGREGTVHGVLAVYSLRAKAWREEEVEALRALAGNASAALANAELYQRVTIAKEQADAILANIGDGIVAVDREGRVVLWNRAAEGITGVAAAEAMGRTPAELLGRELEPLGRQRDGEVSILRGGEETRLSLTEAIMRDPAGAVAGRIFAIRDVSAERFVEQMKTDFVSAVSQELRRPLASIYGFAETLLRSGVEFGEDERRTFLRYIAAESERLTAIVDALLNVARLETGDLEVNLAPTDVTALVSEVVSAAAGTPIAEGPHFVADVRPSRCGACRRGPLRQAFSSSSTTRSSSRRTAAP